ncbi:hypothetical protein LIER_34487 [Lithospermum erythrorhizon]|uniref:Uncharacterized protein n=1 Tax=Lithospermum erythrorhizon TaxID=34254 RepID=A0AAV3S1T0_LITER
MGGPHGGRSKMCSTDRLPKRRRICIKASVLNVLPVSLRHIFSTIHDQSTSTSVLGSCALSLVRESASTSTGGNESTKTLPRGSTHTLVVLNPLGPVDEDCVMCRATPLTPMGIRLQSWIRSAQ